jgi:hypothetical protein
VPNQRHQMGKRHHARSLGVAQVGGVGTELHFLLLLLLLAEVYIIIAALFKYKPRQPNHRR